jgi:hypothetical protein
MRRIVLSVLALGLTAAPSFAVSVNVTCRDFAMAMADEYLGENLVRAEDGAPLGNADQVLIIGAGKAHYVPRYQSGVTKSYLKQRMLHREIYNEEYWRCMRGGNITINVDPSALGDN